MLCLNLPIPSNGLWWDHPPSASSKPWSTISSYCLLSLSWSMIISSLPSLFHIPCHWSAHGLPPFVNTIHSWWSNFVFLCSLVHDQFMHFRFSFSTLVNSNSAFSAFPKNSVIRSCIPPPSDSILFPYALCSTTSCHSTSCIFPCSDFSLFWQSNGFCVLWFLFVFLGGIMISICHRLSMTYICMPLVSSRKIAHI